MGAYPTQVGSKTQQVNSTANTTANPTIPTGLTNGQHWMIFSGEIFGNKTASISTPTGWTALPGSPFLNSASTGTLFIYYKKYATGDTTPSVTWTTNNKNASGIVAYKDVDLTTILDIAVSSGTGASTTPTSPSTTAVTMGATRIHIHGIVASGGATPNFDQTEQLDAASSNNSAAAVYLSDQPGMATGALGTRIATTTSASWVAVTIWLRPAVPTDYGIMQTWRAISSSLGTTIVATAANALTAGSTLLAVAGCVHVGGASIVSVTSPAGTWIERTSARRTVTELDIGVYYWQNNTNTTADAVTLTISASENRILSVYEIIGAATSGTLFETDGDSTATSTAVSTTTDATTTSGARFALFGFSPFSTQSSIVYNTNYIPRLTNLSATFIAWGSATREFAGGSTETATATLSASSVWVANLVILLPGAATVSLAFNSNAVSSSTFTTSANTTLALSVVDVSTSTLTALFNSFISFASTSLSTSSATIKATTNLSLTSAVQSIISAPLSAKTNIAFTSSTITGPSFDLDAKLIISASIASISTSTANLSAVSNISITSTAQSIFLADIVAQALDVSIDVSIVSISSPSLNLAANTTLALGIVLTSTQTANLAANTVLAIDIPSSSILSSNLYAATQLAFISNLVSTSTLQTLSSASLAISVDDISIVDADLIITGISLAFTSQSISTNTFNLSGGGNFSFSISSESVASFNPIASTTLSISILAQFIASASLTANTNILWHNASETFSFIDLLLLEDIYIVWSTTSLSDVLFNISGAVQQLTQWHTHTGIQSNFEIYTKMIQNFNISTRQQIVLEIGSMVSSNA